MGLFVTEFRSLGNNMIPSLGSLAIGQNLTISASVTTGTLGTQTQMISLQSDAGCYVAYGSSTASITPASSNGVRIGANQLPQRFDVSPNGKLFVLTT